MKRFLFFILIFSVVFSACANDVAISTSDEVVSDESYSEAVSSESYSEAVSSEPYSEVVSDVVSSEEPSSEAVSSAEPVSSEETVSKEPKPVVPIESSDDYFEEKSYASYDDSMYLVKYLFHEPIREYDEKRPLVIFLHGLGDSVSKSSLGTADPIVQSLIKLENESEKYGTYTLVPMTPLSNEGWWTYTQLTSFKSLIKQLVNDYNIDPCRVYVSGISMGGMVTTQLVNEMMPGSFAAAVTLSGAHMLNSPDMHHITAFRIYHSAVDTTVSVSQSRDLAKQLQDSGHPNFEYIEFSEGSHVSPIYKVFRDNYREFFDWLFAQKLERSTLDMPF